MDPDLETAQEEAYAAAQKAGQASAGVGQAAQEIKNRLNEAFNYNQDIIDPLDEATAEYLSAPKVARERYQNIFNPFSREKLVSQYTGNKMTPMLSYANILGTRRGNIAEGIEAGSAAYNQYAKNLMADAQLKRQMWQDLYKQEQDELANQISLEKLALERQKATQGGGMDIGDLLTGLKTFEGLKGDASQAAVARQALRDIEVIKNADPNDYRKATILASKSGRSGVFGNLLDIGTQFTASAEQEVLADAIRDLRDILQRERSGAAIAQKEEELYTSLVGDPISTWRDNENLINEVSRLEPYFLGFAQGGTEYEPYIDMYRGALDQVLGINRGESSRYTWVE